MKFKNDISININAASTLKIPDEIQKIDLNPIKYKLVLQEGWSLEKADEVELLYKGFLALAALFPDDVHVPTQDIDEMWHHHILDSRKYMADCLAAFGAYIHHYPYLGLMGTQDRESADGLFERTRMRLSMLGINLTQKAADCGGSCGSSCGSSCGCDSGDGGGITPSDIFPVIASCGSSTPAPDRRREERKKDPRPARDDGRDNESQPQKKRRWMPGLRIWGASVDPEGFATQERPDRAALEALAEARAQRPTLN